MTWLELNWKRYVRSLAFLGGRLFCWCFLCRSGLLCSSSLLYWSSFLCGSSFLRRSSLLGRRRLLRGSGFLCRSGFFRGSSLLRRRRLLRRSSLLCSGSLLDWSLFRRSLLGRRRLLSTRIRSSLYSSRRRSVGRFLCCHYNSPNEQISPSCDGSVFPTFFVSFVFCAIP